MKVKFSSFDVACVVKELQKTIHDLRVVNVYDINNKSYIIKLGQETKFMLYIESGSRIHLTSFNWPKQLMPSAFSAKCRKVMRNRRLTNIKQIGCDRIIDLQFGYEEQSSHLIIELYDKGNICLCDHEYIITAILRTRQDDKEDIRYAVGHFYLFDVCQKLSPPTLESIQEKLTDIKPNTQLRRWLNFIFPFSIPLIDHCLLENGLQSERKITCEYIESNIQTILLSLQRAYEQFEALSSDNHGFIFYKEVKGSTTSSVMNEFHPRIFNQMKDIESKEFFSYNEAIDVYFYEQETQKIEIKSVQQEKTILKKLDNIKSDHENRIKALQNVQESSSHKAYLIELNLDLVEDAIHIIQNLIANRLSWEEIDEMIEEGKENGHQAALAIKKINLDNNRMSMVLGDPFEPENDKVSVDIDLSMGAYNNAKRYFDEVKHSSSKEQKTIQSSAIALKNAEKKTQATIKDISIVASIKKARKPIWFEKFLWFVSSEGYIVIGGRDAQQNEILVKKYLRKHDAYVHADIHGATSIIIKNKSSDPLPPKTLMEAGCFALCHSSAWTSKIVTSAYWVHAEQVSKTAPTGEYLTTGSFMIRGKKNFLPPAQHVLGFSVLFKIDEESVEQRRSAKAATTSDESQSDRKADKPSPAVVMKEEVVDPEDDEIEGEILATNAEADVDNLFEKYNLQISAVAKPEMEKADLTEFVGTAHNPNYKKRQEKQPNYEKKQPEGKSAGSKSKRGQKGKKKRLEKYADQSDDEREAMMALLGSAGTKKEKVKSGGSNSKLKYKATSTAKNVVSGSKPDEEKVKLTEAERVIKTLDKAEDPEPEVEESETKEEAMKTDLKPDYKPRPVPAPPGAPGDHEHEGSDTEDAPIDFLDSLVLSPLPSDTILFGVPFVAPYNAMTSCKYRVKLTPGSTKKGKACKTILDLFSRDKSAQVQEKNIFKSLKDVDMTTNIPGKVKISAPNLYGHKR